MLDDTLWNFNYDAANIEEFNNEIKQYQIRIREKDSWDPGQVVLDEPAADVQYMVWIEGPEALLKNEELVDDEDIFEDEDNSEDGLFQVEIIAHLKADNGKSFTALELMYKIHCQLQNKEMGDHSFFEGLREMDPDTDVRLYDLALGS